MHKIKPIYLSLATGILLILGWPCMPSTFFLLLGFVPLLIIHHQLTDSRKKHLKFWGYSYLAILIFNIGTTWWVWNASPSGCLFMLFPNALILSIPFLLFSITYSKLPKLGYMPLLFFYIAIEYLHFNWNASWPWLTLGKGLAMYPNFIQWYEYTGELGGTAFVLVINIWVFSAIKNKSYLKLWQPALLISLLSIISFSLLNSYNYKYSKVQPIAIECVISQPNIDPYTEKFGNGEHYIAPDEQLRIALSIAKPLLTNNTELLLLPETAVTGNIEESTLNTVSILEEAKLLTDSNNLCIITGAETYHIYKSNNRPSISARFDEYEKVWFDCYNTSIAIHKNNVDSIYHKSKLVPGVEKMPFEFLEKLSINLGGASGTLGTSKKPINFFINKDVKIAPLICYESVFGDYTTEFVKSGANVLALITNDAWWGNTPGHRQHLVFGAIRCIETRKEMVRSANTGISAKVNVYGKITQQTKYGERTAFRCSLIPNNYQTFYVKYGSLIGKLSIILTSLIVVLLLVISLKKKLSK